MKTFNHQEIVPALQRILQIEQRVSGIAYLKEFAKNIAETLESKYVLLGHAIKSDYKSVQTDVVWADRDYFDNFIN
jgi:hypothetical protein